MQLRTFLAFTRTAFAAATAHSTRATRVTCSNSGARTSPSGPQGEISEGGGTAFNRELPKWSSSRGGRHTPVQLRWKMQVFHPPHLHKPRTGARRRRRCCRRRAGYGRATVGGAVLPSGASTEEVGGPARPPDGIPRAPAPASSDDDYEAESGGVCPDAVAIRTPRPTTTRHASERARSAASYRVHPLSAVAVPCCCALAAASVVMALPLPAREGMGRWWPP